MSELHLIKKLERLNQEKPNKEWVNFTRDSILLETHTQEAQGVSVWFNQFKRSSFMPMTLCIFLAVICGIAITIDIPTQEMQTAEIEPIIETTPIELTASIVEQTEVLEVAEVIAEPEVVEENSFSVTIDDMNNMLEGEVLDRASRIKEQVKECKRAEAQSMLTDEQKQTCEELEEQLNTFEKFLGD